MQDINRILLSLREALLLAVLGLVPYLAVYLDVVVIGNELGEISATEILQETLLLITIGIFLRTAWRQPERRGFLVLLAGFFGCAFVRELNNLLDLIADGFWYWVTMVVAVVSVLYVLIKARSSVLRPMAEFTGTRSSDFIAIGLSVLLVLSRTLGSGNLLWEDYLKMAISFEVKTVVQESLELFGYLLIVYGAYLDRFPARARLTGTD